MKNHHETNKRRQKAIIFNVLSALVILGAVTWGITVFFHFDSSAFTDDAQVEAYINPVNTRVAGYIKTISFSEHQQVKKGDTLVVIDDREYKIQLEQAEATLADAQANKIVANSGTDVAANGIAVSRANLDELKARLDNMEINYKRYQNLLKEDIVTQFQFDQVQTDLDATKAKYRALQAQQQGSSLTTSQTGKRVAVADAAVQKARAAVDMAKLNLSYTVITAPYNGVVGRKIIEEGQLMQAGQPLVSLVRGDGKWVTANYSESQIGKLQVGSAVQIRIDALTGKTFRGRVAAISEATGSRFSAVPVDNSTGNFVKVQQRIPVKIDFAGENNHEDLAALRAGMNAEVKLIKD
ncbi:HlyD family secretion protein [Mucilaginibacter sp. cycad4]|uniref:HlyD family secretion protein n=1 Tax=Mucilaginibacter sp. cycad4 TaxID=3342096 RepID=UPI002AAB0854|nr:HlyD family secretion protein [Mucilaginibacter gossypii]WPV01558.1 HlyD family secretion protein [Mucilaginibacter gossypii]